MGRVGLTLAERVGKGLRICMETFESDFFRFTPTKNNWFSFAKPSSKALELLVQTRLTDSQGALFKMTSLLDRASFLLLSPPTCGRLQRIAIFIFSLKPTSQEDF